MTKDEIKTWLSKAEPLCGMVPLNWEGRPAMMVPDPDSVRGFSVLDPVTGWSELDARNVFELAVPITWREYVALTASEHQEWSDRVAQEAVDSINQVTRDLPPAPLVNEINAISAKRKEKTHDGAQVSQPTHELLARALKGLPQGFAEQKEKPELAKRADRIAAQFAESINKAVAEQGPAPTAADLEKRMQQRDRKQHQIVDVEVGGTTIKVDVSVQDDGGLQIFDLSYGRAAEEVYGEGRDVEHWIDISPEATRQLSVKLFRDWVDDPAGEVARHFATRYLGDTRGVRKIRALLDELDVPYERHLWP